MPSLIALCGPQGAGKSQAARSLVETQGYVRIAFADPIYRMLAALLDIHPDKIRTLDKNTPMVELEGKTLRDALQSLGTEWGRDKIGQEIWVRATLRKVERLRLKGERVVIDDLRFRNEYDNLRRVGCCIVKIEPKHMARQVNTSHRSEADWPNFIADAVIDNPGDGLADWIEHAGERMLSALGVVKRYNAPEWARALAH